MWRVHAGAFSHREPPPIGFVVEDEYKRVICAVIAAPEAPLGSMEISSQTLAPKCDIQVVLQQEYAGRKRSILPKRVSSLFQLQQLPRALVNS